jgi:Uma2 family endonuclease
MVADFLTAPGAAEAFAKFARPQPLADGEEPENRVIFCGIGWQRYLALDAALGDDRPGPRFYYLDGDLEIMTTSNEHERIKKWIGTFLEFYFEASETWSLARGQATLRIYEEAGAEPDESWCIGEEKQWPDIVLEVALSSGGVNKLSIYRHFGVPEVWFWRNGKLEFFALRDGAESYEQVQTSRVLPHLPVALLEGCVAMTDWPEARRAFRAGLSAQG